MPVSMIKLEGFKKETAKDLQKLKAFIKQRWPDDKGTIPSVVKPYLTHQNEISEVEAVMLRGNRIIVP